MLPPLVTAVVPAADTGHDVSPGSFLLLQLMLPNHVVSFRVGSRGDTIKILAGGLLLAGAAGGLYVCVREREGEVYCFYTKQNIYNVAFDQLELTPPLPFLLLGFSLPPSLTLYSSVVLRLYSLTQHNLPGTKYQVLDLLIQLHLVIRTQPFHHHLFSRSSHLLSPTS
jgi:hypothetical protein